MGITVQFTNQSSFDDGEVFVGFYTTKTDEFSITNLDPGGEAITWIYAGTGTQGHWYSLEDLAKGVRIDQFVAGRIFVCYNKAKTGGWTIDPGNRLAEPAQTPTLGGKNNLNFWMRYDKMELTVTPSPYDVADLTSIDFWSIPMSLQATKNGQPATGPGVYVSKGLLGSTTAKDVYQALLALSTPPVSGLPPIGDQPYPALVPGKFPSSQAADPTPGEFARILGPPSYPSINPQGLPITPYRTLESYMKHLLKTYGPGTPTTSGGLGDGVVAKIAGTFGGSTPYDTTASIDSNLDITIEGSQPNPCLIQLAWTDLEDPAGLYGSNPASTINGTRHTGLPNDIYGWIIADFCGGLNIGAVGSTVAIGGTPVGEMPSEKWFDLDPHTQMFSHLQPNNVFYNTWAETLTPLSQAYNFAFTDRLKAPGSHVQVSLDQTHVDGLTIELLDESVS